MAKNAEGLEILYDEPLLTNAAINRGHASKMMKAGMKPRDIARAFPEVFRASMEEGREVLGQKYDSIHMPSGRKSTRRMILAKSVADAIAAWKKSPEGVAETKRLKTRVPGRYQIVLHDPSDPWNLAKFTLYSKHDSEKAATAALKALPRELGSRAAVLDTVARPDVKIGARHEAGKNPRTYRPVVRGMSTSRGAMNDFLWSRVTLELNKKLYVVTVGEERNHGVTVSDVKQEDGREVTRRGHVRGQLSLAAIAAVRARPGYTGASEAEERRRTEEFVYRPKDIGDGFVVKPNPSKDLWLIYHHGKVLDVGTTFHGAPGFRTLSEALDKAEKMKADAAEMKKHERGGNPRVKGGVKGAWVGTIPPHETCVCGHAGAHHWNVRGGSRIPCHHLGRHDSRCECRDWRPAPSADKHERGGNPDTMSQAEHFQKAQARSAAADQTMLDLLFGPNPISDDELRKLIAKRPHVYGKYAAYLGKRGAKHESGGNPRVEPRHYFDISSSFPKAMLNGQVKRAAVAKSKSKAKKSPRRKTAPGASSSAVTVSSSLRSRLSNILGKRL